jgi:3-hydroxyacyl-[acyl-carrier-protein] dehydratase
MVSNPQNTPLSPEAEARLRESFKRCSPATVEAIICFRARHDAEAVLPAVHGIIERYTKLEPGKTLAEKPDSAKLGEDLGIDSLTMLEIVMSIEEALEFRIEDADLRCIRTIGDVRRYVDDRVHGRPSSLAMIEVYDRDHICLVLPQQPPFLFLDRAEIQGDHVRGIYLFRGDEFFFPGHFRNHPIVPASIVYEALGQAACLWLLEEAPKRLGLTVPPANILFVGMNEARFSRRAQPGDEISLDVEMTRMRAPLAIFNGRVSIAGQLLARVEGLTLAFGDLEAAAKSAPAHPEENASSSTG